MVSVNSTKIAVAHNMHSHTCNCFHSHTFLTKNNQYHSFLSLFFFFVRIKPVQIGTVSNCNDLICAKTIKASKQTLLKMLQYRAGQYEEIFVFLFTFSLYEYISLYKLMRYHGSCNVVDVNHIKLHDKNDIFKWYFMSNFVMNFVNIFTDTFSIQI